MKRRAFLTLAAAVAALPHPLRAGAPGRQGLVPAEPPRPLPAVEFKDAEGRAVPLSTFKGKPVLLNVWASYCAPCVAELPALDRLKARDGGIIVLAVSLDPLGAKQAGGTLRRLDVTHLDLLLDPGFALTGALALPSLPTTLLIDREGREIGRFIGAAAWDGPEAAPVLDALRQGRRLAGVTAPPVVRLTGPAP